MERDDGGTTLAGPGSSERVWYSLSTWGRWRGGAGVRWFFVQQQLADTISLAKVKVNIQGKKSLAFILTTILLGKEDKLRTINNN